MTIIGGRITKVEAEKMEDAPLKTLDISFNVEDVKLDKNVLQVHYNTVITYAPSIARIMVKGEIFLQEDDKKAKELFNTYKETKRLPNEVAEEVITAINFASTSVGTLAAFAIGVSAPLNIPKARVIPSPDAPGQPTSKAS